MKKHLLSGLAILAASLLATSATPGEDVIDAARALGAQTNYSWKTTVEFGLLQSSASRTGRTEKGGYTLLYNLLNSGGATNMPDAVIRGTNALIRAPDKGWCSVAGLLSDPKSNTTQFAGFARTVRDFKTPSAMAAALAAHSQNLRNGTNGITGELDDIGKKMLLGDALANNTNCRVALTFWISEGLLAKYQWRATGTVNFKGALREMDRKSTTEILEVNRTKTEVPEEARRKLD